MNKQLQSIFNVNNMNYSKMLNYLIIAYAFCVPLSKAGANLFAILLLLLWLIDGKIKYKFQLIKYNKFILLLSIFIGYSFISLLWAKDFHEGLEYISKYRHFLIVPIIYTSLNKYYIKYILSSFLLAIFISEIFSYGIFFEIWKYKDVLPTDPSPFLDHMTYSTFLAFASSVLLIKFFIEKELKYKILYILFFLSITTNLFINGGRTGQVIFIILIFVLSFHYIKYKIQALFITIVLLGTIFFVAYNYSDNFNNRANSLKYEVYDMVYNDHYSGSSGARVSLWIVGVNTFLDNILLGTGIGNDMNAINQYSKEYNFDYNFMKQFDDHHSTFITLSVQFGIVGFLFSLFMCYIIFTLKFKNNEYYMINKMFIVSFILFSLTHNTLHTSDPLMFFVLFAGLFNAISKLEEKYN